MVKKFSLKLYREFKLVNYPELISFDHDTKEEEIIPESNEYCITFSEYIFNLKIDEPIYELKESFENVHAIFVQNKFDKNQKKRDEYILDKNNEQVITAFERQNKWGKKRIAYEDSLTVQRRIKYLDTVLSEFNHWYDVHGLEFPSKVDAYSSKAEQKLLSTNESTDSTSLASFMCKLLKTKRARNYLTSDKSYEEKIQFVKKAIEKKSLSINYNKTTLKRYIKPDRIAKFLS